jgi:hypothetical protein
VSQLAELISGTVGWKRGESLRSAKPFVRAVIQSFAGVNRFLRNVHLGGLVQTIHRIRLQLLWGS